MDRNLDALQTSPGFSWRRLVSTLAVSAAVLAAGSYLVRSYPNSGYQAGYDAVMEQGDAAVRGLVEEASGAALPLCDRLHASMERRPSEPRYEYQSFIDGCRAAIDDIHGVPVRG